MMPLLRAMRRRLRRTDVVRAAAGAGGARRALLLYSTRAFLPGHDRGPHQNVPQQRELAAALAERGYVVDVADYDERRRSRLAPRYDLVVDLHPVADPVYRGRLAPRAVRIAYITGTNPVVANAAERARLEALRRRRGTRLRPRRAQPPFPPALAGYDAMFLVGNAVTLASYDRLRPARVHLLPNGAWDGIAPTPPARRDPRRFLYLGSAGQVHKGLDLLLECVAGAPGIELVVCGDFRREHDFVRAYRRELTAVNVRAAGWMDLRGDAFRELQSRCGAMLLPSCAEGQAGTVTLALAFGLPCVVTAECGVDAEPPAVTLVDGSLAGVARAVAACAPLSAAELAARSTAAAALAQRRYTHAHYAAAVRAALDDTLAAHAAAAAP